MRRELQEEGQNIGRAAPVRRKKSSETNFAETLTEGYTGWAATSSDAAANVVEYTEMWAEHDEKFRRFQEHDHATPLSYEDVR